MTPIQSSVVASLDKRQLNSLNALQNKVERDRGINATVRVTNAQFAALQAAYNAAKAAGHAIPPEVQAKARALGLE